MQQARVRYSVYQNNQITGIGNTYNTIKLLLWTLSKTKDIHSYPKCHLRRRSAGEGQNPPQPLYIMLSAWGISDAIAQL